MPYVAVKAFPRGEEACQEIAERINQVLMDTWGCPPHTISISVEEVAPEDWDEQVKIPEMDPRDDAMLILHGEKHY